jgi:hypothetical protein
VSGTENAVSPAAPSSSIPAPYEAGIETHKLDGVYEVSISYSGRTYEEGKRIRLKDACTAFYCIVRYWMFD